MSDPGTDRNPRDVGRWRFVLMVDRQPTPEQVRALGPTASLLWRPGTAGIPVRFDRPAPTLAHAVLSGVRRVERAGLRALRVDADDWVTVTEVAARLGRSREAVRLWAVGRVGPGGFPPPLNPGRDTAYYSWAEVLAWLQERGRTRMPDEEPVLAAANLALQLRALMPRLSTAHFCVRELTGSA